MIELGDGILGGYSVETVFADFELLEATAALVFCASDYVGAWGGIELLRRKGVEVDVISGSVTDSRMGEDYIRHSSMCLLQTHDVKARRCSACDGEGRRQSI